MSATEAAIEWRGASKRFPGRTAVDDLALAIPTGSVWGLLGPNGAGKTTALRMALGFARPSGGTVRLQGLPPDDRHSRVGLGFLPERLTLPAHVTVAHWLGLHARLIGLPADAIGPAVRASLERTGVADRGHERIGGLSKGLRQRVGFAVALLGAPSLLILDEPASGLDPLGMRDARTWIEQERERGATVLISSHQLSEVERVCDAVAILDQGRLVASGSVDVLLAEGETLEDAFVRLVRS